MTQLNIRHLQRSDYQPIWELMRQFTNGRNEHTTDELWLLEHNPVFTQGQAGKAEHILNPHNIPIVQTDRGGQVTYHGPGQLMLYSLFDIRRMNISTRDYVMTLEQVIIKMLAKFNIKAAGKRDAPGVYVNDTKICSIGLRVRRGYSYHGMALNVSTDLTPFSYINPCGFKGLQMSQISDFYPCTLADISTAIIPYFIREFGYTEHIDFFEPWSAHEHQPIL